MEKKNREKEKKANLIRVKTFELKNIQRGISGLNGVMSLDLGLWRSKISRKINEYLEDLTQFTKTLEWEELDRMIKEINEKHCVRDEHGNPLIMNDQYMIKTEDIPKVDEMQKKLEKDNPDKFKLRKKLLKDYEEKMKEEAAIDLEVLPVSLLKSIEHDYEDAGKHSPFKTETIDQLSIIIDFEDK